MENETKKPKREPVTVRMDGEIIALARNMAKSLFGSEDKLGNFLEAATEFYSAHHEDEERATALLKTTEDILFRRVSDQFESMSKELQRKIIDRVGTLQAVSSYETALTELILKEIFITKGPKYKARYEELRSAASEKMRDRMFKAGAEQIAKAYEQSEEFKKHTEDLESQVNDTEKAFENQSLELETYKRKIHMLEETAIKKDKIVESYKNLISWYTLRDAQASIVQDNLKGFMKTPTYEEVNKEFEKKNPRPLIIQQSL